MAKSKNFGLTMIICLGILIGVLIKIFIFEFLYVSGTSMEPALENGKKIFVNKLAFGIVQPFGPQLMIKWKSPEKNNIVVYMMNDKIVVKRCVGVSGDLLEFSKDSDYNYFLHINEKKIPLTETQFQNLKNSETVPDGFILAIGDNYSQSVDSRNYGFVSVHNILGKVL